MSNRLSIIQTDRTRSRQPLSSSRADSRKELQAKFERLWLLDPEQFNPLRNCMQKERLERTWLLLNAHTDLHNKKAVDLGCAAGVFSRRLRDAGAYVEAVDIAENALKYVRKEDMRHMEAKQDAMPNTSLPDKEYDIVVCTDVIADLPANEYRLFFAELSRLVKSDGYVLCSTPIDIYTEGGVQRLQEMAETELDLLDAVSSYHALYIRLRHLLEAPFKFVKGWQDSSFKQHEMDSRRGLNRLWFCLNSSVFLVWIWFVIRPFTEFLLSRLKNSRWALLKLEKICQFFWDEAGVSHYLFIGQRRPLQMPEEPPIERPKKKEIWE